MRVLAGGAGAALALLLAGCGPGADDPAQGGVSAREAQALNEAAAMLDDNGQDAAVVSGVETNADAGADSAGNAE